ncbi:MAG: histidine--tRNA ligase [Candidatus Omnitrophica bacterium]|nr:histidine--tRNA ligase [Candidatus Omnitrophota bacterium]
MARRLKQDGERNFTAFMFTRVRGTQDILPQDSFSWQEVEEGARRIFSLYGYQEIRTPILEKASLFNHSLGETTEIVQKQMFEIKHSKDHLVLRPEGTVPVVRAFLENNLNKTKDAGKFYYIGPMFRAERPQKGRLRQFHHIGAEAIGSISPYLDIEIISLSDRLLKEFGVKDYEIVLNSLGCSKDKAGFAEELRSRLKGRLAKLCPDCQKRYKRNVFRILDCKNAACKKIISSLSLTCDYLCSECRSHFESVTRGLESIGISCQLLPSLVRGLDYYTRTVFEIRHNRLGSQDALGAGGRYDNLVSRFAGGDTPAIGFAFGVERLLLARDHHCVPCARCLIYVIPLGQKAEEKCIQLLHSLRSNQIAADMDYSGRSLKAKMRQANEANAGFCVIIGENELAKGVVTLKNMACGEQEEVKQEELIEKIKNL